MSNPAICLPVYDSDSTSHEFSIYDWKFRQEEDRSLQVFKNGTAFGQNVEDFTFQFREENAGETLLIVCAKIVDEEKILQLTIKVPSVSVPRIRENLAPFVTHKETTAGESKKDDDEASLFPDSVLDLRF